MIAKSLFSALAVAGLVLSDAAIIRAQNPGDVNTAQEAGDVNAQSHTVSQSLGVSINAVDVWRLTCAPTLIAQSARARVVDRGGLDNRRIYLHLKRQSTGITAKTVAPDGTGFFSGFASIAMGSGGAAFIEVSKDRTGAPLISEPYTLQAECRTFLGGAVVHTLGLVQNQ